MHVKVVKVEKFEGTKKDGSPNIGAKVLFMFPDNITAENFFISEEFAAPESIAVGDVYDLYRSGAGFVQIFNKITTKGD